MSEPFSGDPLVTSESDSDPASALRGAPDHDDAALAPPQFTVDGEASERDWPLITRAELDRVLAGYPRVGALASLSWHSPRPFSAAVLATTEAGAGVFVKRHHRSLRDVAGLEEEHRFIAHLRGHGVPVAEVLTDTHGRTASTHGDWTYELHAASPGVDTYRGVMSWKPFFHASHAAAAGRMLATLHRAAAGFDAPARELKPLLTSFRVLSSPDLRGALDAWVAAQPRLARALEGRAWRDDVERVIGPFHRALVPWLDTLAPLWTHGDWHASNLLWTDDAAGARVATVLDFGLADRSCAVLDIATAIERNMVDWLAPAGARRIEFEHLNALLDGYESVLPLSGDAYRALAALLPVAHAEFALSEVEYFNGILSSPVGTEAAYDGYLIGHAQWFAGADGQRLLDAIRARRPRG
ncbi:phosphotransferase enzyme family protein [Burkholderia plantarii]|uniref:phosphotransferase enzyme family protein n=1 Tax=Burkholderia plantarii TaxID=41899 RepID=UPI000706EAC0|nr:Aminoglycoside phosphotransferase [Burkholderia plantarii]GLZ16951.1 aminoglycoside phosphotransferase [Burkholderia plantarii]